MLLRSLALTVVALAVAAWAFVAGVGWLLPESVTLPWIGGVGFLDDLAFWAAVGGVLVLSVFLMVPVGGGGRRVLPRGHRRGGRGAALPGPAAGAGDRARAAGRRTRALLRAGGGGEPGGAGDLPAVPPLAPFVFWIVNGFLLGREYFQLVAMRRVDRADAAALRRRHFGRSGWPGRRWRCR